MNDKRTSDECPWERGKGKRSDIDKRDREEGCSTVDRFGGCCLFVFCGLLW
jgi:hypothetical protein